MSIKNKIILLSDAEIDELYNLPNFTNQEMELYFALLNEDYTYLRQYRTLKNQIYFIPMILYQTHIL